MLEKILLSAINRPSVIRSFVRGELERLRDGGYLDEAEVERITREGLASLEERLEGVRGQVTPLVRGLGSSVRELLDIPSRAEILALTEALREAREASAPASGAETSE